MLLRNTQTHLKQLDRITMLTWLDKAGLVLSALVFLASVVVLISTMTILPWRYVVCYATAAIGALRVGWILLGYDEQQNT